MDANAIVVATQIDSDFVAISTEEPFISFCAGVKIDRFSIASVRFYHFHWHQQLITNNESMKCIG